MTNKCNTLLLILFLATAGLFFMPLLTSCGKGAQASNVGLNTQLQILNLSPDVHPVNLYINFINQNITSSYIYPNYSGYFYLNAIDTPIQIRSALRTTVNLLSIDYNLLSNHKYSLFITGINADTTLTAIVTADDTTATPPVGFGKIRFVNASVLSPAINVAANGTTAFSNIMYKQVSKYIQLPAGNYIFQMSPVTAPATVIATPGLQATTIQDGRLYTLYSYGEYGRTDSAAFGAGVLINR